MEVAGPGDEGESKVTIVMLGLVDSTLVAQAAQQPNTLTMFLPLVLIMGVFYFLMIRPAQTQRKKVAEMLKNLKVGDKVITNGGVYGTIAGLEDEAVQLRIAEQVKVKVARSAIAGIQPDQVLKES
jgi:preprotein translocase subunit YajC